MRDSPPRRDPAYERPKLKVLGTFAGLTQGKGSGTADFQGGHPSTHGPGS